MFRYDDGGCLLYACIDRCFQCDQIINVEFIRCKLLFILIVCINLLFMIVLLDIVSGLSLHY